MSILNKITQLVTVSLAWQLSSRRKAALRGDRKVHVLFCMCDHYEPGTGKVSAEVGTRRVEDLLREYPLIADAHRDSHGNKPRRSWFYPPHYHQHGWLKSLVSLCERGYGEVELHLHHGKQEPDTSENLRATIKQCIDEYAIFGVFGEVDGRREYGFIHGDWALDNSRNGEYCGVNDEISILKETGCYADFTFPCYNDANPKQINSIYYAKDDPARPKSHDTGEHVCFGGHDAARSARDLLMVEGPFHPYKRNGSWRIFGDAIDTEQRITIDRINRWVQTGISVKGKENWIIIKTHTHGASDGEVAIGPEMHTMFSHLEATCRDRPGYALHYVTARELYNVIAAAEAGETGDDPAAYKDYRVKPPRYDSSPDVFEASAALKAMVAKSYRG